MLKFKPYAHYLVIFGLVMLLMAVGQLGQGSIAWADGTNFQTVPTRTPTPGSDDGDNDDTSSSSSNTGTIVGQVTDLSTGQPGAGVTVRLNDIEVQTDAQGKYSLSGLGAGVFVVSLVLEGDAVSAQDPIIVTVDGATETTVDLDYYSDPSQAAATATPTTEPAAATATPTVLPTPVAATATPAVALAETTDSGQAANRGETAPSDAPQLLPQSGGYNYTSWLMLGLGLISLVFGLKLNQVSKS